MPSVPVPAGMYSRQDVDDRENRIAVVGASGFIGSHVLASGHAHSLDIAAVRCPRVRVEDWRRPVTSAESWRRDNAAELERFVRSLVGFDVVVNAAGMGAPTSTDEQSLYSANAVQPLLVARACRLAGVRRLVHISTAAVQGRLDPLDETARHHPFSPYTYSKAEGERLLLEGDGDVPGELIVYRPSSVQGVERAITRRLARLAHAAIVPISGKGDQPLPLALIDNVAEGILFSALSPFSAPIVIQPSEHLTTRRLFECFSARRLLPLPPRPVGWVLSGISLPLRYLPALSTSVRGLELLYRGQRVAESTLTGWGFVPPVGHEGWEALGSAMAETPSGTATAPRGATASSPP